MANAVATTKLHEGPRNVVYSTSGILDTSDYAATDFTTISALTASPTGDPVTALRLDHMFFSIQDTLNVLFYWHATSDVLIFPLEGRGKFDFDWFGGYNNTRAAGWTGNLRIATQGWVASAVLHFAFVAEFTKQYS